MKRKSPASILAFAMILAASIACNIGKDAPQNAAPGDSISAATPQEEQPVNIPPIENNPPASACDNPYYPNKAGNSWTYQMTAGVSDTFIRTILANTDSGFTDQDTFGTGAVRTGEWKCENGNLTALSPGGGQSATVAANGLTSSFHTTALEGISLPAVINPGDSWTQNITIEGDIQAGGTTTTARNESRITCNAIGAESVTVPAGTFDAIKLECTTDIQISMLNGDTVTPLTSVSMLSTTWYAANVGWVKSVSTGNDLDNTIELTAYTVQ